MSRALELPDPLYESLHRAAAAVGTTPAGWIAARLAEAGSPPPTDPAVRAAATLADRFAGRLGRIASGDGGLSESTGEALADAMEAKRRSGTL